LFILGVSSIIYANPLESDMPHIMGLFEEKKMLRDHLGENAGTIKLENIERLIANPARAELTIKYREEIVTTHKFVFASPAVRDEALTALEQRLGEAYTRRTHSFSMKKKILPPVVCILLIAGLEWLILGGTPLLSQVTFFQTGLLQLILYNIQYYINLIGALNILMIGVILVLLCLVWLVVNLSKPTELIIIERKS
jgi:hypothetical protein